MQTSIAVKHKDNPMRWWWAGLLALMTAIAIAQEPKPGDAPIRVECHGQLRHGEVAVGGETTGTFVRFLGLKWELQFKDRDGKAFAESHHKQPVSITGTLRRVSGVERAERWIVDVERSVKRDPPQTPEGASITLVGVLVRDPRDASQWQIRHGDLACPVKLPVDTKAPVNQRLTLRGSLEAIQPASESPPFSIRATKLEIANRPTGE